MSKLLTEYFEIPLTENIIEEAKTNDTVVIPAILQRANALNQNERVYPLEILEREVQDYNDLIKQNRALGELDHPDSTIVNLQNVCLAVREQYWDGDTLKGSIEILNTPAGNIAKNLISAGVKLGVSSRGIGSVKESDGRDIVQDDFKLIAYDIVSNPSTEGAFLGESIEINKVRSSIDKIYRLMNDIITTEI